MPSGRKKGHQIANNKITANFLCGLDGYEQDRGTAHHLRLSEQMRLFRLGTFFPGLLEVTIFENVKDIHP